MNELAVVVVENIQIVAAVRNMTVFGEKTKKFSKRGGFGGFFCGNI